MTLSFHIKSQTSNVHHLWHDSPAKPLAQGMVPKVIAGEWMVFFFPQSCDIYIYYSIYIVYIYSILSILDFVENWKLHRSLPANFYRCCANTVRQHWWVFPPKSWVKKTSRTERGEYLGNNSRAEIPEGAQMVPYNSWDWWMFSHGYSPKKMLIIWTIMINSKNSKKNRHDYIW